MPDIGWLYFDIGGVLGTDGWDRHQRARAVAHFGLDPKDFEDRHQDVVDWWEDGRISMEQYLDATVFYEPRAFSRTTFQEYMFAQSQPDLDMIAFVRALRASRRYRVVALSNESAEMTQYRIQTFGLIDVFDAFMVSCYLRVRKPAPLFYRNALAIVQADPTRSVFIDDRVQNLHPARNLGMHTIAFTGLEPLRHSLAELNVFLTA
jgi:putative hydrolase of the HAD superfamily